MKLRHRARARNHHQLDFFDLLIVRHHHLTLPARRIRQRFGLSEAVAITTAELAGFAIDGGSR